MNKISLPQTPEPPFPRFSSKKFPAYRFIPGLTPHPTEDPSGHSYRKIEPETISNDPHTWFKNDLYLFGADLYNYAYWWEAHEAFETLWKKTERLSVPRDFFQGLIKISGAFLKWQLKHPKGIRILFKQSQDHLQRVQNVESVYFGLDLKEFQRRLCGHFQWLAKEPISWPNPIENYPFLKLQK